MMKLKEAAEYLGISADVLRTLCKKGAITFLPVSPKVTLFEKEWLEEYKQQHTVYKEENKHE